MENVSEEMRSLCEDIVSSYKDRKKHINELREEAETISDNAREFIREIRSDLAEASQIWNKMNETLRNKKAKSRKRGEVK